MRKNLVGATLILLMSGCAGQSSPQIASQTPRCKPSPTGTKGQTASLAEGLVQVTFYGDLLPVLSSIKAGKIYKCTTCHAEMAKPDGLNSVDKLNRAIESMTNGRMPRPGDPVPKEKIELFRIWQLQGFQEGDKDNQQPGSVAIQPATSTNTSTVTTNESATAASANSTTCP